MFLPVSLRVVECVYFVYTILSQITEWIFLKLKISKAFHRRHEVLFKDTEPVQERSSILVVKTASVCLTS